MVTYKQDMPPPGGYAAITYQRVPPKLLNVWWTFGAFVGTTTLGWILWKRHKRTIINQRIEMRCAEIALRPLFVAEQDRLLLKQLKKNRDYEAELMKDVPNWEVGKFYDMPVYLSVKPDDYMIPNFLDYYAHSEGKYWNKVHKLFLNV